MFWVVVNRRNAQHLERRFCESRPLPSSLQQQHGCQFVRHLSFWVPVEVLDLWDIRYTMPQRDPGELVVTAPGASHQSGLERQLERGRGDQLRRRQERCWCARLSLLHH